jgi:hypothetical protein
LSGIHQAGADGRRRAKVSAATFAANVVPIVDALRASGVTTLAGIIVKRFPAVHPVAANTVAMTIGGVLLLALSLAFGENWTVPAQAST